MLWGRKGKERKGKERNILFSFFPSSPSPSICFTSYLFALPAAASPSDHRTDSPISTSFSPHSFAQPSNPTSVTIITIFNYFIYQYQYFLATTSTMLSSFNNNTSSSSHDPDEDSPSPSTATAAAADLHFHHLMTAAAPPPLLVVPPPPPPHTHLPSSSSFATSALHVRHLLARCAELISSSSSSDDDEAHRLVAALAAASSPFGDSTERLAHQFAAAFSLRLQNRVINSSSNNPPAAENQMQSCYLSLNQITPFIRFAHLTANQAILESVETQLLDGIHIVDFEIMQGVQWPPLMQALAERRPPPPLLRITGTGRDLETLHRTGDRLSKFAQSLGLNFQFHPVVGTAATSSSSSSSIRVVPGEALAVNCMFYLHRLVSSDQEEEEEEVRMFLRRVKELNPRVVTVGEREVDGRRVGEAVEYYGAVFESLEETVPPGSGERAAVEGVWFGREIKEAVAMMSGSGSTRRMEWWGRMMRRCGGFRNVGLSPFAISQAKLLLRLHYPCEGYRLQVVNHRRRHGGGGDDREEEDEDDDYQGLFLGWRDRPLFSFSSWR